jgi:hypothetical protein
MEVEEEEEEDEESKPGWFFNILFTLVTYITVVKSYVV